MTHNLKKIVFHYTLLTVSVKISAVQQ